MLFIRPSLQLPKPSAYFSEHAPVVPEAAVSNRRSWHELGMEQRTRAIGRNDQRFSLSPMTTFGFEALAVALVGAGLIRSKFLYLKPNSSADRTNCKSIP